MQTLHKAKQPAYLLATILMIVVAALTFYLMESRVIFDFSDPMRYLTNGEFYLVFGIHTVFLITYLIVSFRHSQITVGWHWLILFLLWTIVGIISLVYFQSVSYEGNVVYTIDFQTKLRYIFLTVACFDSLYAIFAVFPKTIGNAYFVRYVFKFTVLIAFAAIAYSLVAEFDVYAKIFDGDGVITTVVPGSFFKNRNGFGYLLLAGIFSEAFLEVERPSWWRWLLMLFFYAYQFIVLSKTCLLLATVFLVFLFCWQYGRTLKAHPFRNNLFLLLVIGVVILFFMFPSIQNLGALQKLQNYIAQLTTLVFKSGLGTMNARFELWGQAISAIGGSKFTTAFGFGLGNWPSAVYASFSGDPTGYFAIDSSWVTSLLRGGFVGFSLTVVLWVMIFGYIIASFATNYRQKWVVLFSFLCIFARSFVESGDFSFPDGNGFAMLAMFVFPVLVHSNSYRIEKNKSIDLASYLSSKRHYVHPVLAVDGFSRSAFVGFPIFAIALSYWKIASTYATTPLRNNESYVFVLFVLALITPFVATAVFKAAIDKKGRYVFWIILSEIIFLGLSIAGAYYFDYVGSLFVTAGSALVLLAGLLFFDLLPSLKAIIFPALTYLVFFVGALALNYYFILYFLADLIPFDYVMIFMANIALWLFLFVALPFPRVSSPFADAWSKVEDLYLRYSTKLYLKNEARFLRHVEGLRDREKKRKKA